MDENGLTPTAPRESVEHVQKFYTRFYECDQTDPLKQNHFLSNINAKLSSQQKMAGKLILVNIRLRLQ